MNHAGLLPGQKVHSTVRIKKAQARGAAAGWGGKVSCWKEAQQKDKGGEGTVDLSLPENLLLRWHWIVIWD